MKLSFFLDLIIIFLIAFFTAKKRLHVLTNLFNLMVLEMLITCYFAILYINLDLWEVDNHTENFFIFRLHEVVFMPLLYIWYFNLAAQIKSRVQLLLVTEGLAGILLGSEFLLVQWEIIIYKDWHYWNSIVFFHIILLVSSILQQGFRQILQKEGIEK